MSTIKLNAEKRIQIGNEFEAFYRNKDSKAKKEWLGAIKNFDEHKDKIHSLCHQIVRKHQPQEDVDTIKRMISKYGNNGGDIFNDHCFNFQTPTINDEGEADTKSINIDFGLTRDFACSYYDKELRASGKDPDYANKYENGKKNPTYYNSENEIEKHFEIVITGDCLENHKPDPEGLHRIATHFNCDTSQLVMIGDHDVDITAAKSAGAFPIRANWHGFKESKDCPLGAMTIHSIRDLTETLL